MEWYYAKDDEKIGPISQEDVNILVKNGIIKPETLIWSPDWNEWKAYSQVAEEIKNYREPEPEPEPEPIIPTEEISTEEIPTQVCSECFLEFPEDELIQIGEKNICQSCKSTYLQKIREGFGTKSKYAGFWIRFVAKFIDGMVMSFVSWILFFIIGLIFGPVVSMEKGLTASYFILVFLVFAFQLSYYIYFVGKYSATPGKMLTGIQIIMADGAPLSYKTAAARYFSEMLSAIIMYVGYIMAAFDEEKRTLHDRICNTRVVF